MDPAATDRTPPSPSDLPLDAGLLLQLQAGDRAAFHTAIRPLLGSVFGLARRLFADGTTAEELVQETLIQAYQSISGFRGEASLRTWVLRITARLAQRPERWRGSGRDLPLADAGVVPDVLNLGPEDSSRERELAERLDEAMERLTTKQRTALHLRAIEGLDYRHIAQVLGGTETAARMLVLAARKHVMQRMGRHLEP